MFIFHNPTDIFRFFKRLEAKKNNHLEVKQKLLVHLLTMSITISDGISNIYKKLCVNMQKFVLVTSNLRFVLIIYIAVVFGN